MQTVMYSQTQLTFQEVDKISYQPMLMAHDFYSAVYYPQPIYLRNY